MYIVVVFDPETFEWRAYSNTKYCSEFDALNEYTKASNHGYHALIIQIKED